MKEYLNHRLKISTKDGAHIQGILIAFDKAGNFLLDDSEEYYKKTKKRYLGLILLHGSLIKAFECLYKIPTSSKYKKLFDSEPSI